MGEGERSRPSSRSHSSYRKRERSYSRSRSRSRERRDKHNRHGRRDRDYRDERDRRWERDDRPALRDQGPNVVGLEGEERPKDKRVQIDIHPLLLSSASPGSASFQREHRTTAKNVPVAAISTVQANIKAGAKSSTLLEATKKGGKKSAAAALLAIRPPDLAKRNRFFDKKLPTVPLLTHRPRTLNFVAPGTFQDEADKMRAEQEMARIRREVEDALSNAGFDADIIREQLLPSDIPSVEWWDRPFLESDSYEKPFKLDSVNNLIQRPALLPPPIDVDVLVEPRPLMLTKTEQKKLRRQRRLAEHKERQEQIKLGLLPPEPQKVRIANIARILGTQSVQEPSRVEAEIRAAALQRHQLHQQANRERKEAAKARKQAESPSQSTIIGTVLQVSVALFRVKDLSPPQWRFKVHKNAQQYELTGCIIYHPGLSLVLVEGAATPIRKYTHLLMDRIRWREAPEGCTLDLKDNVCDLVWEGTVYERSFRSILTRSFETEREIRDFLQSRKLEHYWTLAKEYQRPEIK